MLPEVKSKLEGNAASLVKSKCMFSRVTVDWISFQGYIGIDEVLKTNTTLLQAGPSPTITQDEMIKDIHIE